MTFIPFLPPGITQAYADTLYADIVHTHGADAIVSGQLALARGGTNADLSATGGATSFLRQASAGAAITVGAIASADLTTALTTPPAIGGTTPAAGTFTEVVGTSKVVARGGNIKLIAEATSASTTRFATLFCGTSLAVFQYPQLLNFGIQAASSQSDPGNAQYSIMTFGPSRNTRFDDMAAGVSDPAARVGIFATTQPALIAQNTDAATNTVTNVITVGHNSSSTPAASFGAGLAFQLESSTTENRDAALISADWSTATDASRASDLVASAYYTTTKREGVRIRGGASDAQIGFLGATPVSRASHIADPSGGATTDAEARTAINAILVVLENLGFVATS